MPEKILKQFQTLAKLLRNKYFFNVKQFNK